METNLKHGESGIMSADPIDDLITEVSALSIAGVGKLQEHHNPLDIPFGHEVTEVNNNIKDVDEGGFGSGRHKGGGGGQGGGMSGGGDSGGSGFGGSGGVQPGPLISFGETILKELMDVKIRESCPCHKKK